MLNDLRYALRQLFKSPWFTIVAVLTIALGIGANTAIFSVVSGVLLHPLPYPNADRLVTLYQDEPNFDKGSISYPNFLDWQRMNRSFDAMAAYRPEEYNLSGEGEPEHLQGEMISGGFFEMLGVKPLLGRTFRSEDDHRGAAPTAMISEGLWRRKYGAARNIIGQRLIVDGVGRTVIGVVPAAFLMQIQNFQENRALNDIYTPIGEFNEPAFYAERSSGWGMCGIGRLRSGITLVSARQDMGRVARELAADYPAADSKIGVNVVPLKEEMVGDMRRPLLVLLGAVTFVLLISCVNVANLLLARSTSRQREFAIRLAIGAGQLRLMRQLLTESIVLALIGGGLGLLLAQFGTAAAVAAVPRTVPRAEEIGLDYRVLIFTALSSLAAGIIFGLAPAFRVRRANVGGALKESGRGVAGTRSRMQRVFVMAEMALAVVLLVGAGLMIRTLIVLWALDPGFNPRGVTTFMISPDPAAVRQDPAAILAFLRKIHEQIASAPGMEAVSLSWGATPMNSDNERHFWFDGRPKPAYLGDMPVSLTYLVEPDYRKALQISVRRGRFLEDSDNEHGPTVAVIDETLADKYFRGQDPIGKYLDLDTNPNRPNKRPRARIVGIVNHINQWGLDADAAHPLHAQLYLPIAQLSDLKLRYGVSGLTIYARGTGGVAPDFEMLRRRLLSSDRGLVVFEGQPMEQVVLRTLANKRFTMTLLAAFGALALVLASIGIYGVLSYLVGQRTQEIGIRMALGAARLDVLRMILTDGARLTAAGIGIGVAAALALTQVMSSLLFGVRPTDFATFGLVILALCSIALAACYLPARRAMQIDPILALREE
jgi:putative ABC transport system permease protein